MIACGNYAVLIAGSKSYSNYRHQADIFHHYQILKQRGIPAENIIVFAYDDVANDANNKFKGKMFNSPKGVDVYEGVKIDYVGKDNNAQNFINCITGNKDKITITNERSTGRVLQTTEKDNVWMFFSDHGNDNLIAFPTTTLYADQLNEALKTMHTKKMYNKLVFYLEACYSGSMFENKLPTDINIYATTAANAHQSSYAYYCGSQAVIDGVKMGTCLGDEYSIRFMEDFDEHGDQLKHYTLAEQYKYLKGIVEGSQVMQYGDVTEIPKLSPSEFIDNPAKNVLKKFLGFVDMVLPSRNIEEDGERVSAEDYRLYYYKMRMENENSLTAEEEYYKELEAQAITLAHFNLFNEWFHLPERNQSDKLDFDCYRKVMKIYDEKCGLEMDRDFKYMTHLANFCTRGIDVSEAEKAFSKICLN
jgi:legumain